MFKISKREIYTLWPLNWFCGIAGLLIVGLSTHWNPVALIGAFVTGLHFTAQVKK